MQRAINFLSRKYRICTEMYQSLRYDSGLKSLKLASASAVCAGAVSDFCSPWLNLIGWVFPASIMVLLFALPVWYVCKKRSPVNRSFVRSSALSAIAGLIGILVFGPIFSAHVLADKNDDGVLASLAPVIKEAQTKLANRLDKIETAVERQTSVTEAIRKSVDTSTATTVLDRALQARDGSNQGQVAALEALIAAGHTHSGVDFSGVSFKHGKFRTIVMQNALIHFSDFSNTDLTKADLSGVDARFADLSNADLSNAKASDVFAPFLNARGAIFRHADLRRSNLYGADLKGADLRNADLTGATLTFADLSDADLRGAKFNSSFLTGAVLKGAKLAGAELRNTDALASSIESESLTAQQQAELCRHAISDNGRIRIELIERWPSDRFASGYEFEDLNRWNGYLILPQLMDQTLQLCSKDNADNTKSSNVEWIRLHLDRQYLSKSGRRKIAMDKLKVLYASISRL